MNSISFSLLAFTYAIIFMSVMGFGLFAEKIFFKKNEGKNIGFSGLLGIFFLIIYSYFSHFFLAHGIVHNSIIIIIGVIFFFYFAIKLLDKIYIYLFFSIFIILFISLILFKTHDDFPFYHFPYSYYLTQYPLLVGTGLFNSGFKTPSSIFYLNSLFYLPIIKYYTFHITPILFLGFVNLILILRIVSSIQKQEVTYLFYLNILIFLFINIFFYRIQEHGTDRSAQILIFLFFLLIFDLIKFNKNISFNISYLLVVLGIIISLKAFYVLYLIFLIPVFFIIWREKKIFVIFNIFKKKIFYFFIFLMFLVFTVYFLNSGCFLYPVYQTCIDDIPWSTGADAVRKMNDWYQQWSKAGATPNFRVEDPLNYIKGFNWVSNWFNLYFFNKVSDFLLGLLLLSIFVIIFFRSKIKKKIQINKNISIIYLFIFLLFFEWFYNHPALRYGGYCLIALLIFIPVSLYLSKFELKIKKIKQSFLILILITITIFIFRNFNRIQFEIVKYDFKPFENVSYRMDDNHFRIEKTFEKLILNYQKCKKNENECKKDISPKIREIFSERYIFLADTK